MRIQLSTEWVSGTIQPYGDTHDKQVTSIRKKIYDHRDSASHKQAVSIQHIAGGEKLKAVIVENQKQHLDTTCNVFRTVYYIARKNRPFLDHAELIELQELNGVHTGRMLHSNVVAADIVSHIADEMKKKLVKSIIEAKLPFSILIDESTSLSQKSCMIVYVRCSVSDTFEPVTCFLDLLELSGLDADALVAALIECLHANGLNDDILSVFWLGLATDGASVMLGKKAGVYMKLKQKFPNLIGWHCFNHRLELSVHDAVKACTELNHFKIFIDKLYTVYSVSPKNRRNLDRSAAAVGVELLKIGRVLDVRWVASSFRTVRAVWTSYPALFHHFSQAAVEGTDSKERSQFKGLAAKLSTSAFLLNLAVMYDALEELSELSESLQAESISLHKAHRLITRQVEVFVSRKTEGGERYLTACQAVASGVFNDVPIAHSSAKTDKEINRAQFYQSLADSISARLMPAAEKPIVECVNVLFPAVWPSAVATEYGEMELKQACNTFLAHYSTDLKQQYRDFKDAKGAEVCGRELKRLKGAIDTLPVSTAECERGFSRMNLTCTPLRSSLTVSHMSSLLFISLVGPPLREWQPLSYVQAWLAKGRHAATDVGKSNAPKICSATEARKAVWKCL